MNIKLLLGITASALTFVAFVPYFKDIFQRRTQPHLYSWLVWSLLQGVGTFIAFKSGAGYGVWGLAVGSVLCTLTFLLGFKYGTKNIKKFDIVCLFFSLVAIGIYVFLNNPLLAVIVIGIIDFVGFLPTYRKGWEEPYTETLSTYIMSAIANLLALLALQSYSFESSFYVASIFLTNTGFAAITIFRRSSVLIHEMKLTEKPFNQIKSGIKTIEIRLNDEKRKRVKIGDTITFTCNQEKITIKVKNLLHAKSFRELIELKPFQSFGLNTKEEIEEVYKYYTNEEENEWGVLGIEFLIIN